MNTELFDKAIEQLQEYLKTMRANRAHPTMIENLPVFAYNSTMRLQELATITIQEAQTLVVQPWDTSVLKAIENALREADIGASPVVDGEIVRLNFPPMTEEKRKEMVKQMHEKVENARIAIRKVREQLLKEAKAEQKAGSLSEDEYFRMEKEIQQTVDAHNATIEKLAQEKEKDLMTI